MSIDSVVSSGVQSAGSSDGSSNTAVGGRPQPAGAGFPRIRTALRMPRSMR